jgi:hypothetical protein
MSQTYTVKFHSFGNNGFVAWIDGLKGMVEQANTPRGALEKIMTGLRIKFAYDNNLHIDHVTVKEQEEKSKEQPKPERKLIVQEA